MFRAGMECRGLPALKQKTQKDGLLPMACELSGVGSFLFILGPYSTSAQGLFVMRCFGGVLVDSVVSESNSGPVYFVCALTSPVVTHLFCLYSGLDHTWHAHGLPLVLLSRRITDGAQQTTWGDHNKANALPLYYGSDPTCSNYSKTDASFFSSLYSTELSTQEELPDNVSS